MKEAIGGSQVFNIIIIFVGIIIVLLVGSLSYSKVFKIKTKVINIIENNKGYNNDTEKEIIQYLNSASYNVTKIGSVNKCPDVNGVEAINTIKGYEYCVYRFNTVKGSYYRVTVFISYDIPIIGSYIKIPVTGETRIIYGS